MRHRVPFTIAGELGRLRCGRIVGTLWVGTAPHGVYTVEAVFKGNVKSDRAVCEGGGSN